MMTRPTTEHRYRPTESQYKDGAAEYYLTYDLEQRTAGDAETQFPHVKRVYLSGELRDWTVGDFKTRTGRQAHGVRIRYAQTRRGYRRRGFAATRGGKVYQTDAASVQPASQQFTRIVELPERAQNVRLHPPGGLPPRYRSALQDVR